MLNKNRNPLISKNWIKKLTCFVGIAGVTTLISFPVLAKFYSRYALFQPSAYSSVPYRNSNKDIAQTLIQDSKFANLVGELKQAGLLDTLKQGEYTIFAPTDKAFNALPKDVFKRYSQSENRTKVLQYHLVAGQITKENVDSGAVKTIEGQPVKIVVDDSSGTVKLNDAIGKYPSTVAKNGVIIEVDKVLLPSEF
ncbi:fasciclin domain-containing protein [Plectonema radiosum NIES-515]|uniref:Fasciclin domain-containing protein n=1 Tax=Plectonema radiosum NIES-515 TaxID=2986073 RepID=A0ABT3AT52_9CYAN|nr:fasciclin domain-containing protein [Plectonema radiosum]MCV3212285.1 fasciclin domain-containing protein [Plectonema radiosum NIES-515]